MSRERDGASPSSQEATEGSMPENKGDGKKALLLLFGAIAFILAPRFLLGK